MDVFVRANNHEAMSRMAASLHDVSDLEKVLEILTHGAVDHLDGVQYASITVLDRQNHPETVADTHPVALDADHLQYELGEGPCFEAARGQQVLVSCDVGADPRWPRYGPQAAALGIRSQLSFFLGATSERRTAFNLYGGRSGRLLGHDEQLDLFIAHAAYATGATLAASQMSEALRSRKAIGQALGIVMARYWLDEDRAFQYLVRQSQNRNVKLRDVCAEVVTDHNNRVERAAAGTGGRQTK